MNDVRHKERNFIELRKIFSFAAVSILLSLRKKLNCKTQ